MDTNPDSRKVPSRREPDDWLDAVLRADGDETKTVVDDGFTARVLERLPRATSRHRNEWIVPAMGVLGIVLGLGAFSGAEELSFRLLDLLRPDAWSLRNLMIVALPLALLYGLALEVALGER